MVSVFLEQSLNRQIDGDSKFYFKCILKFTFFGYIFEFFEQSQNFIDLTPPQYNNFQTLFVLNNLNSYFRRSIGFIKEYYCFQSIRNSFVLSSLFFSVSYTLSNYIRSYTTYII